MRWAGVQFYDVQQSLEIYQDMNLFAKQSIFIHYKCNYGLLWMKFLKKYPLTQNPKHILETQIIISTNINTVGTNVSSFCSLRN